jgi:hypothetical protein
MKDEHVIQYWGRLYGVIIIIIMNKENNYVFH